MNYYTTKHWIIRIGKIVATYNLPRVNHEEIENLSRPITRKKVESIIKPFPKVQEQTVLQVNSTKNSKNSQYQPFSKSSKKTDQEGIIPCSSYKASITLIPKSAKDTTSKEKYRPILLMNVECKNLHQNISKLNSIIH